MRRHCVVVLHMNASDDTCSKLHNSFVENTKLLK